MNIRPSFTTVRSSPMHQQGSRLPHHSLSAKPLPLERDTPHLLVVAPNLGAIRLVAVEAVEEQHSPTRMPFRHVSMRFEEDETLYTLDDSDYALAIISPFLWRGTAF